MTTGLQRAQVLRFSTATDALPRRAGGRTSIRRRVRELLALGRTVAASPRRAPAHRSTGATPRRAAAPPRARDVHDAAVARGIAPPF